MSVKYCLPIIKNTPDEVLDTIRQNEDYSYFEVWLDYVESADEQFVKQLAEHLGVRLIVLFRRQRLEPIKMSLEQRLKLIDALSGTPVLLDLDIGTQTEELEHIREQGRQVKTIVSYHDYERTPDTVRLEEIVATMDGYRPAIYKLATLCSGPEDSLRLLQQLLALKAAGKRAIVLGMGEAGLVTRIFGSLWGNEMVFAPLKANEASALGQLTRAQFEVIFKELKHGRQ